MVAVGGKSRFSGAEQQQADRVSRWPRRGRSKVQSSRGK